MMLATACMKSNHDGFACDLADCIPFSADGRHILIRKTNGTIYVFAPGAAVGRRCEWEEAVMSIPVSGRRGEWMAWPRRERPEGHHWYPVVNGIVGDQSAIINTVLHHR
jgi:hypothetical protein